MKKLSAILQSREQTLDFIIGGLGFCNPRLCHIEDNPELNLIVDLANNNHKALDNVGILQAMLMRAFDCQVNIFVSQAIKPLYYDFLLDNSAKLEDQATIEKIFQKPVNAIEFSNIQNDINQESFDDLVEIGDSLLKDYKPPILLSGNLMSSSFWSPSQPKTETSPNVSPSSQPVRQYIIPANCLEKITPFVNQQTPLSLEEWHTLQEELKALINAAQPMASEAEDKSNLKDITTPVKG